MDFLKVFGNYNEYIHYYEDNDYFEIVDDNIDGCIEIDLSDLDNLIETLNILKEEIENNESN